MSQQNTPEIMETPEGEYTPVDPRRADNPIIIKNGPLTIRSRTKLAETQDGDGWWVYTHPANGAVMVVDVLTHEDTQGWRLWNLRGPKITVHYEV